MRTGGGIVQKILSEEPDLDILLDAAVDVEHKNVVDSDAICISQSGQNPANRR